MSGATLAPAIRIEDDPTNWVLRSMRPIATPR